MQEDLITMDISDENLKPITTAAQVDEDDELADELAGQI
jgi:hypothetical protein